MSELSGRTPPAEQDVDLKGITAALDQLEPVDPELIGAIKEARTAGVITPRHYSESITGTEELGPRGTALTLTDMSNYPEVAKAHRGPGVLEISAHDWAKNDKGERTVVTGTVRMTEDGQLFPTTELTYPVDSFDAPKPGTQGNVTRIVRPSRTRASVEEQRVGEGSPDRIRAMAIDAARKIVEERQAEGS